jgi:tRNA A-37 threonylcarbamoyl transferase component Bud32/tetratricopeptide (TPR) repeat protein
MTAQDQEKTVAIKPQEWLGTVIAGKYDVLELLGQGGMSSVYKARHQLIGKIYALKVMHPQMVLDNNALTRFRQEAAAAATLSHPNIITLHDFDVEGNQPFQAIDYLDGCSLAEEIHKLGKLEPARAINIFIQVCSALAHAHEKGVIHRDLKPSNVMLVNYGEQKDFVKIVDFGIAKVLPQEGEAVQRLTQTGELFGSPLYMSPEQCLGQHLDARSDIYSMGCLMYETLTGKPPLFGTTVFATIQKHIDETPKSLKEELKSDKVIEELDHILEQALAKLPAQRQQSMTELLSELERIRGGKSGGVLAVLNRWFQVLSIRFEQLRKRLPARFMIPLAVTFIFLCVAISFIVQICSVHVPAFKELAWPEFSTEASVTRALGAHNDLAAVTGLTIDQIDKRATESVNAADPVKRARYCLAPTALFARNGDYEQAAAAVQRFELVRQLSLLARQNPDVLALMQDTAPNRLNAVQDFCAIGDACYLRKDYDSARFFFDHAAYQLAGEANHLNRRIAMKLGDCAIQRNDIPEADRQFHVAANLRPSEEYPDSMFKIKDDLFSMDRATWFGKAGDVFFQLGENHRAAMAYQAAAKEWKKDKNGAFAAQALYRLADVWVKENQLRKAEEALKSAIAQCGSTSGDVARENLPALHKALAEVYRKEYKFLEAFTEDNEAYITLQNARK